LNRGEREKKPGFRFRLGGVQSSGGGRGKTKNTGGGVSKFFWKGTKKSIQPDGAGKRGDE